jgi:predicted transcriptional regulator
MSKHFFTMRLDDEVLEVAQRLAADERRSVTAVIEVAVLAYQKKQERLKQLKEAA